MSGTRVILTLALWVYAASLSALELGDTRVSGFGTVGVVTSSNDELLYRRDVTQKTGAYANHPEWATDTLVGIQADTEWSNTLSTTAQLVVKERAEQNLDESIHWAFVRYRPVDGLDIRLGRLGTDIFMLSDHRQVSYAYPWVRPPSQYYGLLTFYHFDGADITKKIHFDSAELSLKAFYGGEDEVYPVAENAKQTFRLKYSGGGFTSVLEKGNWTFRLSYADVVVANNNVTPLNDALSAVAPFWPEATKVADYFVTKNRHLRFSEIGFNYDANRWWVQAEHTLVGTESRIVPPSSMSYLTLGARFEKLSVFTTFSELRPRDAYTNITGPQHLPSPLNENIAYLAATSEYALKSARANEKGFGIGVRWDFKPKMSLKLQADKFSVNEFGSSLWLKRDPVRGNSAQDSIVTSISWDFIF